MAWHKVRVASFAVVISVERSAQAPMLLLWVCHVCWTVRCREVTWLMSSVFAFWGVK